MTITLGDNLNSELEFSAEFSASTTGDVFVTASFNVESCFIIQHLFFVDFTLSPKRC